jgi:dihydrofolate reductase
VPATGCHGAAYGKWGTIMRKIVASAHLSLDGVMQGQGSAEEDPSGGFDLGGWSSPFSDEEALATLIALLGSPATPNDLLLGRKTYDIFAGYWPHAPTDIPFSRAFNKANKYVLTRGDQKLDWAKSHKLRGIDELKKLKADEGPDIVLWGSSTLYPPLLEANLIDRLNLLICPIILGKGKKLFGNASQPVTMKLVSSEATKSGVIVASYECK